MKIAVITDLHYAKEKNLLCPERHGEKAKELLALAVEKLNSQILPDILLVGGDLVNDPEDLDLLRELAELFQKVKAPKIILPGNHDPAPEIFYTIFPEEPGDLMEIEGFQFLAFPRDKMTEGCNSLRSKEDIQRMKIATENKPTILFQHYPLYGEKTIPSVYSYNNIAEILSACGNVILSISGHDHCGYQTSFASPFPVIIAPALCEWHFPLTVIELDQAGNLLSRREEYLFSALEGAQK